MDEQTVAPGSEGETKPVKSRRLIFVAVGILLIAIVAISVVAFSNRIGPLSGIFPGNAGVTMVDLQMDYDAWRGTFKSYHENDTLTFRDTIVDMRLEYNKFDQPITVLDFHAHLMPSLNDLEASRVQNESWYQWRPGTYAQTGMQWTIFILETDSSTGAYLPEASIQVSGDVRDRFSVGDTIQTTLHVIKGVASFGLSGFRSMNMIYEFNVIFGVISPQNIQKV